MAANKNPHPWTAVIVTSCSLEWANFIQSELLLFQKKGVFDRDTYLLSVEDPDIKVGSGGATLNALLVVVEHLSAKRGYTVLTANVLYDSRILVIHNGRSSVYSPCGKAFLQVPSASGLRSKTNMESLVDLVNQMATNFNDRCGLWVCSTDWLLSGKLTVALPSNALASSADCFIFCSLGSEEEGIQHGTVKLKTDHNVANIYYRQSIDIVRSCKLEAHNGQVPLVLGIVYISPELAESLALLHSNMEVISCTHLGIDSGSEPIQVSLYFDILAAIASDVDEGQFVNGVCGESYGQRNDYRESSILMKQRFRRLVWKGLNRYRCQAVLLPDVKYVYLWDNVNMLEYLHSRNAHSCQSNVIINSSFEGVAVNSLNNSLIENSVLVASSDFPITIGANVIVSGLTLNTRLLERKMHFKDDMVFLQMHHYNATIRIPELVCVFFGVKDDLFLSHTSPHSTFCNRPWQQFFDDTGINKNDIWSVASKEEDCLFNAKLYPIGKCVDIFEWFDNPFVKPDWWSDTERISIKELLNNIHLKREFCLRREAALFVASDLSKEILINGREGTLLDVFKQAKAEGWHMGLLRAIDILFDDVYNSKDHFKNITRMLASIADLLDCMSESNGGVRSGPAANRDWLPAINLFEKGDELSIRIGVNTLKSIRENWMTDPRRIIRAARHYEAAVQALIRQNVLTAKSFIHLSDQTMPDIGVWVTCDCPARIDLFGGWTDTPPICYELGGSVINAAISVNGKRPIGAKVKRISDPVVIIHLDDGALLRLSNMGHLSDYNQPLSEGSLTKACLLCASEMAVDIGETLEQQLKRNHGSGLEIVTWSDLPKGSGLGTSSILAAAIIACLWTVSGKAYDRSSLIHAVLVVEQMLTTGGGWQDQVGGLTGGIAHGQSKPGLPVQVNVRRLQLERKCLDLFSKRLVLIYTGKVRLAKNLLQEVLRNWFARDSTIYETFQCLLNSSFEFVKSIEQGNLSRVGELMNEYWRLKKILAAGAEPFAVGKVMKELQSLTYGQLLCGAGGGGFMVALTKEHITKQQLEECLQKAQTGGMKIYEVDIDEDGLKVTVGDATLKIK